MHKVLIIEGATDTTNGDLRPAFAQLLQQKLTGKMPRIVMGKGSNQSVDKFLNYPLPGQLLLLIDLDADEMQRNKVLLDHNIVHKSESVFFMIQEMEAWFLSQPDVLQQYYQKDFGGKINRIPQSIADPCQELQRLTKNTKKGAYHKIKHAVDLLPNLNLNKLAEDFTDVQKLLDKLV